MTGQLYLFWQVQHQHLKHHQKRQWQLCLWNHRHLVQRPCTCECEEFTDIGCVYTTTSAHLGTQSSVLQMTPLTPITPSNDRPLKPFLKPSRSSVRVSGLCMHSCMQSEPTTPGGTIVKNIHFTGKDSLQSVCLFNSSGKPASVSKLSQVAQDIPVSMFLKLTMLQCKSCPCWWTLTFISTLMVSNHSKWWPLLS